MNLLNRYASLLALSTIHLFGAVAHAREAVVVLSPIGTSDEKMAQIEAVALHLIDTVEPGEQAWVIDGLTQEQIGHYALDSDLARYENKRNRMRDNAAFFRDMKRFAEGATAPKEDDFAGKIDFPSVLRTINANYPASAARDLIFYATSPETHDPRHLALSMRGGVVPDDDQIAATRADTIYGASGESGYLTNYAVHWGTNGAGWQVSDRHAHFMAKFVWLSVTERGGSLATFATDPSTALRNAAAGIAERVGPFSPELDGTRTMVHFRPSAALETVNEGISIYERVLSERMPDAVEFRAAENVEIAIRWDCACDFDLAVEVWGDDPISYRAPRGTSGTLFKDFTSSDALNTAWETIAMPGPVDLQALTVAVNKYGGITGDGEVELRLAINGETWGQRLSLMGAADGGSGFGQTLAERAPANAAWAVVDLINLAGAS